MFLIAISCQFYIHNIIRIYELRGRYIRIVSVYYLALGNTNRFATSDSIPHHNNVTPLRVTTDNP